MDVRLHPGRTLGHGVIHGHFFARKYAFLYPRADFITFMREPVARVLSAYYYLKYVASRNPETTRNNQRIPSIVSGRLDPVEFARDPYMVHLYRNYTRGLALEDFRLIGITERFAESIALLNAAYGCAIVPAHERRGDHQRFEDEYRRFLPELQAANRENIEIYRRATALFEERLRRGVTRS